MSSENSQPAKRNSPVYREGDRHTHGEFNTSGDLCLGKEKRNAASTAHGERGNREVLQSSSFALCSLLPIFPTLLIFLFRQGVGAFCAGRGCSVQVLRTGGQIFRGVGAQTDAPVVHPTCGGGLELKETSC